MEKLTRTRLITLLLLAVVFGSGVMLGLAADSSLGAEQPSGTEAVAPEVEVPVAPETERRYIYHEVGPNEVQLARIDSVVAEHRARRDALDEETKARYDEARRRIVLDTREGIKAVLTPEQAAEYQRLLEEWEARRAAQRENEGDRN